MKFALALLFTSLSAFASVEYGGYTFNDPIEGNFFQGVAVGQELRSSSGNCIVNRGNFLDGTTHVYFYAQEGRVRNELQSLLLDPQGRILIQETKGALNPCNGENNRTSIITKNGLTTLKISCSGNPLRGEGSGRMEISVDAAGALKAVKLDNRHGWWENFYRGQLDCRF